jgi:hypothetical protein
MDNDFLLPTFPVFRSLPANKKSNAIFEEKKLKIIVLWIMQKE